jgi:hypothetical protein
VDENETKKLRLKRGFGFAITVVLVASLILWLAPSVEMREGGKISLSRMQLLYGLVSMVIAVAIYIWGVGNWSRFEPPTNSSVSSATPASDSTQAPPISGQAAQPNAAAPPQPADTSAAPKGGG